MRKDIFRGINVSAIAVAAIICLMGPACSDETQSEADFIYAKKAFNDGFYDLAQERLVAFLKSYPGTAHLYETHTLLGRSYYYRNNFTGALYEFDGILNAPQAAEFHADALYWSAEIYLKNGDYRKALDLYEKVTSAFPSSAYFGYAVYSKGWAYYKLGFFEEALKYFRDVVEKYPYDKVAVESQFRIGECEYLMARYGAAEKELKKFIDKYPVSEKTSDAYYMCGEAGFYQAKYSDAIASFERALAITPKAKWASFALYRIAESRLETGKYEESIIGFKLCLESATGDFLTTALLAALAKAYEKTGRIDDALRLCDEIIQKHPSSEVAPEAYYRKTKLLYDAGRYAEAETAAKEGIEKFSGSDYLDNMHYELGWIYSMEGKADDAMGEFLWVENESRDINLRSSAICKIGDIYFNKKLYEKAMASYDVVLDKYSDSFWADYAQYQVGAIFSMTGRYSQAIMSYQSVLANFPNSSWRDKVIFALGSAYFKIGDFERSASEFRHLMDEAATPDLKTRSRIYLANSLYSMKQYAEALAILKAVDAEGVDRDIRMMARYQMGWCYYSMRKDAEALAIFNNFLKDFPRSKIASDVKFWFADYHRAKKNFDVARGYYESVLKEHPSDETGEEALYNIGMTFVDELKADEAMKRFDELGSRFPGSGIARGAYRKAAKLKKDARDYDGAVSYLEKALTKDNDELNAQVQYEIAESYEAKNELGRAVEEYLKVPYLYSKGTFWSVRAQLKCAQLLERMERFDDARKLYEKLADMDIEESQLAKQRLEWLRWRGEK